MSSFPRSGVGMQYWTLQRPVPMLNATLEHRLLHPHAGAWERLNVLNLPPGIPHARTIP